MRCGSVQTGPIYWPIGQSKAISVFGAVHTETHPPTPLQTTCWRWFHSILTLQTPEEPTSSDLDGRKIRFWLWTLTEHCATQKNANAGVQKVSSTMVQVLHTWWRTHETVLTLDQVGVGVNSGRIICNLSASCTNVTLTAVLNQRWTAWNSPTVFAATNFMVGGNFTSSGCSGALASSGLVGLLLSWWGNTEDWVKARMLSREMKVKQLTERRNWSAVRR